MDIHQNSHSYQELEFLKQAIYYLKLLTYTWAV
jgi:hypothetical protein